MGIRMVSRVGLPMAVAVLLASSVAQAVPSKYVKQKAVKAAEEMEKKAEPHLTRYAKLKEQDKLNKIGENARPMWMDIGHQLRMVFDDGWDVYYEAVAEGWPEDDPDLAKAREKMEAARVKFEACGMWTCVRFGEKPVPSSYQDRLQVMRDQVAQSAAMLNLGQDVDDAKESIADIDRRMKGLLKELEDAEDNGRDVGLTKDHPAVKRTIEEIDRQKQAGSQVIAADDARQKAIDDEVAALVAMYRKCEPFGRAAESAQGASGTEEQRAEARNKAIGQLAEFEAQVKDQAEALAKAIREKYGADSIAIDNKIAELKGGPLRYDLGPGYAYDGLTRCLKTIAEARTGVSDDLLGEAKSFLDKADEYSEFIRIGMYDQQRPKLELALKYNPNNEAAKARLAGLEAEQKAKAAELEKIIDARKWGGNFAGFAGPGNVADLVKASLAWIKANDDLTDKDVIALRVVGDWFIFEKDALGRTVAYGLPVEVVFVKHADKAAGKDLAVLFELSMVTRQAKEAPPFKITGVGGSRWIRASKVKQM